MMRNLIYPVVPKQPDDRKRIFPVCMGENDSFFLKETVLARPVNLGDNQMGISYPVFIGESFSLIGISQAPSLYKTGELALSSVIDRNVRLEYIYIQIDDQIFQYDLSTQAYASFSPNPQGETREYVLNYSTAYIGVNKDSRDIYGKPFKHCKLLKMYDGVLYFNISLVGHVNLHTGVTCINAERAYIKAAVTANLTDTQEDVYLRMITEVIPEPSVVAFELDAYFTQH